MSKREIKRHVPRDPPSKNSVKLKTSRSYNIARSKKSLAWYVAYNAKPPQEKSRFPKMKWKCPSKFTLATNWLVAAGEDSHEAEAQSRREARVVEAIYSHISAIPPSPIVSPDVEGESHNDSEIPIIPIIPIEEREGEMSPHISADEALVTTEKNPQPSDARNPSVHANQAIPSLNPSTSQNPPVNNESLLAMLRGLEGDMAVAAAAAATVAAVMESKGQIDTELLIKLITNPEMIKKLINQNGFQSELDSGTTSAPNQSSSCPLEPKPKLSSSLPSSESIPTPIPSTPLHLPSSRPIYVPEPNMLHPLPRPSGQAIASVPSSESVTQSHASLPITKVRTSFDESSGSHIVSHARSAPVYTTDSVKVSPQFTRSMSDNPLSRSLTNEPGGPVHAHFRPVRPPISSFDNNENGKRMIEICGPPLPPDITPINPSTSQPKMEVFKEMKNVYAPHDAAAIRPRILSTMEEIERRYGARDASGMIRSVIPSTMEEMAKRYGAPGMIRPSISPISSTMEEMARRYRVRDASGHNQHTSVTSFQQNFASSGTFHSIPSRPLTVSAPPPLKDFTYYKSIVGQHGERHYELQNPGQGSGLKFAQNMTPTEHYQRPFMHPDRHAGFQLHPPMPPNQWRGSGMVEVPDAKRMRFCEPTWNSPRNWQ